jgi:hypothetical protein
MVNHAQILQMQVLAEKKTIFGKYSHLPKWPFWDIFADSPNLQHSPSNFEILTRIAHICQRPYLRKTAPKQRQNGKFGKFSKFSKSDKYKMPKNLKMLVLARLADICQAVW